MRMISIPHHVWDAACRLCEQFYPITQDERHDKYTVLEEKERLEAHTVPNAAVPDATGTP